MLRRVAVVTNGTLPLLGGAERSCWDRCRGLARLGIDVLLLGPDLADRAGRYPDYRDFLGPIEPGFRVAAYPSKPFLLYADNRQPTAAGLAEIDRVLAEFAPEVLVVVEPEGLVLLNSRQVPGVAAARRMRIPVVFENHTQFGLLVRDYLGGWAIPAAQAYLRSIYRFADATICFSKWSADQLGELGVHRVHALTFPAVDLSGFSPSRRTRARPGRPMRLLYAGRLAAEKRLDAVIDAAAQVRSAGKPIELRLAGDGPLRPALEARCRSAGLDPTAVFTGTLRGDALSAEYADADVFINLCPVETFGLSALESLASGTPAAVPDTGGMKTFVRDGTNGWVIPSGSVSAAAKLLAELCDHPERIETAAAQAAASTTAYSLSAVCAAQAELLEGIARRRA